MQILFGFRPWRNRIIAVPKWKSPPPFRHVGPPVHTTRESGGFFHIQVMTDVTQTPLQPPYKDAYKAFLS